MTSEEAIAVMETFRPEKIAELINTGAVDGNEFYAAVEGLKGLARQDTGDLSLAQAASLRGMGAGPDLATRESFLDQQYTANKAISGLEYGSAGLDKDEAVRLIRGMGGR